MTSVFSALPLEARHEQRLAYRSFLSARDGTLDVERRTLSRREEAMDRYLTPTPSPREIDRTLFEEQYTRYDPRRKLSREMLLLLALVKVNAAEAYGVTQTIESVLGRLLREADDIELILTVEENYHTKILLSASTLYGLSVTAPYRPRPSLRVLIGSIASVPPTVSRPLVLVSELLGTLFFLDLLRIARDVLRDLPAVRDAVEERLCEVIVDEIGHVSFNRLSLGAMGLAQARMLCPIISIAI